MSSNICCRCLLSSPLPPFPSLPSISTQRFMLGEHDAYGGGGLGWAYNGAMP
jgi:hypothetical protein